LPALADFFFTAVFFFAAVFRELDFGAAMLPPRKICRDPEVAPGAVAMA
jgi:hypothetical protein